MTGPLAVSIKTAAQMTDLSEDTIRAAVNRRELPAKRSGRVIRIKTSDLEQWFDELDEAVSA